MRLSLLFFMMFFGAQSFAQVNETPQSEQSNVPQNNAEQISTKSELKVKRIERPRVNAQERKEPAIKHTEETENQK